METRIVLVTAPDDQHADTLAETVVSEGLAACVNITRAVTSIYEWEGKIERSQEALLIIKTTVSRLTDLEERLRGLHPYSVPEFVAIEPAYIGEPYQKWLLGCIRS